MRGNGVSYGVPHVSAIGERIERAAGVKSVDAILEHTYELEQFLVFVRSG